MVGAALLAAGCAGPMGSRERSVQSERISVTTQGSGPDVVLVHGLGSSRDVWREMVAAVPGYRYHLVQTNGFGGAPTGGNGSGAVAATVMEEIARYIHETGLQRPAIIGHSFGGTMSMMLAARHPGAVGRLMVVDMLPSVGGFFGGPNATPETLKPIAESIRQRMASMKGEELRKTVEGTIATMIKKEERRAEAVGHSLASDTSVTSRAYAELVTTDLRPELRSIKVPVTVLYVHSPSAPMAGEQLEAFYRASYADVPQAKLIRIPDAWHFIMWDAPERFAQEVRSFLKG